MVVTVAEMTQAAMLVAAMAVMTGAVLTGAVMMAVAVMMAAAMVMTVAVVAEMKTGFLSKSPPQLPSAKHPAFAPAMMLTLLTQTRT